MYVATYLTIDNNTVRVPWNSEGYTLRAPSIYLPLSSV